MTTKPKLQGNCLYSLFNLIHFNSLLFSNKHTGILLSTQKHAQLRILHLLCFNTLNILFHRLFLRHSYSSLSINTITFQSIPSIPLRLLLQLQTNQISTVKLNIPGAGILQSPIVACLNNEYPASLSSLETVLEGFQVRTNAAVSSNFF